MSPGPLSGVNVRVVTNPSLSRTRREGAFQARTVACSCSNAISGPGCSGSSACAPQAARDQPAPPGVATARPEDPPAG